MATGPGSSYHVSWPASQQDRIVELRSRAIQRHVGADFVADMRTMHQRLADDPLGFGNPIYDYHHLDLIAHHAVLVVLQILYAVDEPRRIVYVQEVSAVPGRALEE